jgi:hypothetical protein
MLLVLLPVLLLTLEVGHLSPSASSCGWCSWQLQGPVQQQEAAGREPEWVGLTVSCCFLSSSGKGDCSQQASPSARLGSIKC